MGDLARQYKPTTVKRLYTLSRNQCAAPDCTRKLTARDGETSVSKICHIEAATNGGPRFNPEMDDEQRRHFNNLILLCDECHCMIDNPANENIYPADLLKKWKKEHESIALYSCLNENPTLLGLVVDQIAKMDLSETEPDDAPKSEAFDPQDKIEYNCLRRNQFLIEEYKVFYTKINALYSELEEQGSFTKERLLRNIKQTYLKVAGSYAASSKDRISVIQTHADDIIESVEHELYEGIKNNPNHYQEDLTFAIAVIMVDAFMRCKILEEPLSQ